MTIQPPRRLVVFRRGIRILLLMCLAAIMGWRGSAVSGERSGGGILGGDGFLGEGIDFKGGMLDWEEDENGHRVAILRNYAVVILPELTISARNMVLNVEMQELYAEGDVVFDEPDGNAFYCDQLTFNYGEWKGLAKNIRVKMDRNDVHLPVADFLDQTPSLAVGGDIMQSLNNAQAKTSNIKRMYVQAQELRAHDRYTVELIDAKITPDAFARPHWYFRSPAALLRRREKIEAYHTTVNIGSVPVLYFPYLIRDLQYDWPWMRIVVGYTKNFGVFARTQWGIRPNTNENSYFRTDKVIFDIDYFSRRGVGLGVESTYETGHLDSYGKFKAYGVYEFLTSTSRDAERSIEDNADRIYRWRPGWKPSLYRNDLRWAVDWEHYQQLNEFWDVRAEAHLYHDRDYLREYDPQRYWGGKYPENSIDLRRMSKDWELEFVAQSSLSNRWQNSAEYYPEMRLTIPGIQLGNLPLFLKDDFRMGIVNRRFDEDQFRYTRTRALSSDLMALDDSGFASSRLYDRDSYGSFFRAFNELKLEAPIKLGSYAVFKPWVGLRTAYYGDTLGTPYSHDEIMAWSSPSHPNYQDYRAYNNGNGYFTRGQLRKKGDAETYYAVPFGAELSTRTYTLFGAHEQWRLINEPVLSYLENSKPKLDYEKELFPIDMYDEYYRQRRVGVELHSKLQRRDYERARGDRIPHRDIVDFNIGLFYYPRERDRDAVNYGFRYSEIKADLIYRPTQRLTFSLSGDYDTHDNTFNRAIVSINWRLSNMFRTTLSHYQYRGQYWRYPDAKQSSQTQFAIRTKMWNDSSHYSIEGAVSYEWRNSDEWRYRRDGVHHGFNKYRVTLYRDIDTFEMSLSYVRDRNDDDQGIFFNLSPKSFLGFDRPPPKYTAAVETLDEGRYPDTIRYLGNGYLIDSPVADAELKDVQF